MLATSQKSVATARLRIERVQSVPPKIACRKATALIVGSPVIEPAFVMMRVEASEVGLTQSEHLSVVVSKL